MTGETGCHQVVRGRASKLIDGTPDRILLVLGLHDVGDG